MFPNQSGFQWEDGLGAVDGSWLCPRAVNLSTYTFEPLLPPNSRRLAHIQIIQQLCILHLSHCNIMVYDHPTIIVDSILSYSGYINLKTPIDGLMTMPQNPYHPTLTMAHMLSAGLCLHMSP